MNIRINDKWHITSEPRCFVLQRRRVVQDGDNEGKEYLSPEGYFETLEQLARRLSDLNAYESEATSVAQLLTEQRAFNAMVRKALEGI